MENREQQILSEIKSMMASIRIQLERLDAKMAELQQVVDPEDSAAMPIDLDIDENTLDISVQETVVDFYIPQVYIMLKIRHFLQKSFARFLLLIKHFLQAPVLRQTRAQLNLQENIFMKKILTDMKLSL